jgi:hypothetical protein
MNEPLGDLFRVTLLGTGAPPPRLDRFGPSTLVEVGNEKFIFDAGRGAMQRLHQLGIPFGDITGMFLTHHHSDHVVGFPDLWLTGWIGRPWGQRSTPLQVWGPEGTEPMMEHLAKAFAVDIRVRRRNYPADGVKLAAHEITEGVVFDKDSVKVTAFEVDHGGEELPAYGYRIDYRGRAAVLSGDTTFNENLIRHAQGVDLIVHEVTAATGSAAESPAQLKRTGDDANRFAFAFDQRQRRRGVVREIGRGFLVRLGKRNPDLDTIKIPSLLSQFGIGAFRVHDSPPRGHPVDVAGLDGLNNTQTVAMNDRPGK